MNRLAGRARPSFLHWLLLFHRYGGIGLGLLMLSWCLSGFVMMYVPYPSLSQAARLQGLEPLNWKGCCKIPPRVRIPFTIEMLAGRPILRSAGGTSDLITGNTLASITPADAIAAARDFANRQHLHTDALALSSLAFDQWTVEDKRNGPFYRIALNDESGTVVYVSEHDGQLVQRTDRHQRLWNRLGAIPHWLYFIELRQNTALWSNVVIWSSLCGALLVLAGLLLGIRAYFQAARANRLSPYRGVTLWHHIPGLFAGVFLLTWVVSGCLSLNPFGLWESSGSRRPQESSASPAQLAKLILTLRTAPGIVSVHSAPMEGKLFVMADSPGGATLRLDAAGRPAPLVEAILRKLAGAKGGTGTLLRNGDDYYFSHPGEAAILPVYRILEPDGTRTYLDPASAQTLKSFDAAARDYRWWFQGLHRLDFTAKLRSRPQWDIVMIVLLVAATGIAASGCWLAIARLRKSRSQP